MRAMLFHNPEAGEADHSRKSLVTLLGKAGLSATYCSTRGSDFSEMLQEKADLFIAAGGDGTVGKVLRGMPDRRIPVAILPLGTANNIARSLGLAGSPKDIIGGFAKARTQRFDLGLACGPWGQRVFVEAVGLGPLTEAMSRIDAVGIERSDGIRIGRDTFRKVLSEARPIRFNLSVDGRSLTEDMLLVEILNIPSAGPVLAFAPEGNFGDGLLDIVCVAPGRRADMLAWLGVSQPTAPPPVSLLQGRRINLNWEGIPLRVDDHCPTISKQGVKVTVEVASEPATVLVPRAATRVRRPRRYYRTGVGENKRS